MEQFTSEVGFHRIPAFHFQGAMSHLSTAGGMTGAIAFIGFGEAGGTFARPGDRAFDRKTTYPSARAAKLEDYEASGVEGCETARAALAGAAVVLSLVTADQALEAAQDDAELLEPGALWLDMNSVAPGTKRAAAAAIEAAGGRYADVAVMAPAHPAAMAVPLLVAGPHAADAAAVLAAIGFTNVEIAGPKVGDASAIKMIRSVMVKGIEALTAECILAANRAGVTGAVIASLDASSKAQGWGERADYNLDRMLAHGTRRAAEMEEVAKTLAELGIEPAMTRGTIARQRELGAIGGAVPEGLAAKLAAIGDLCASNATDAPANAGVPEDGIARPQKTPAFAGVTQSDEEDAA